MNELSLLSLADSLSTFRGTRALVVDDGRSRDLESLARQYEHVDLLLAFPAAGLGAHAPAARNVSRTTYEGEAFPFEDGMFDAVFLFHALGRSADHAELLQESLRLLKQRAPLVLVEYNPATGTYQQNTLLELERLMRDRDSALSDQPLPWMTPETLRHALRALDLQQLSVSEVAPPPSDQGTANALKRASLERIKLDLLPSLSRLGARRDEFERRLIDVKRRVEVSGVAPLGHLMACGLRKAPYANAEVPLMAAEPAVAEPPTPPPATPEPVQEELPVTTLASAVDALSSAELLSLVLSDGQSQNRLEPLAQRILREYGSRAVAAERDPQALVETLGISYGRALQIVATFELGRRFFTVDDEAPVLRGPEDIFRHTADMAKLRREQFRGLYLDNRQRLVADEVISIGTLTNAILHPREVFRPALTHRAVSLVLVHNHPSGDPQPSPDDVHMTRQLHQAGHILGIELLDLVIIGGDNWFSLKDARLF